ncbi:MAG: hypothetical protein WBZ23_14320, partial [Pseudolabrys sp.]
PKLLAKQHFDVGFIVNHKNEQGRHTHAPVLLLSPTGNLHWEKADLGIGVIRIACVHQIGTARAQQTFRLLNCFIVCSPRAPDSKLIS